MDEKKTEQNVKKRGGRRVNAGRPQGKVKRSKKTIWVSEDEMRIIKEFLFQNRMNDPE